MPKKSKPKKKVIKKKSKKPKKKALLQKKKTAKKKKPTAKVKIEKPIGEVTHFFGNIKVAIVKFKENVKVKTSIRFKGATSDFVQVIDSMQFDHKPIALAKKGKEIGLKVKKKVREGDKVYKA